MLALIDSDSYAYAAAHLAEGTSEQNARQVLNDLIQGTLIDLNTEEYMLFCTGDTNFRKEIYPEYKANRLDAKKPEHLAACKQHLRTEWKAYESINCEADDLVGIEAMRDPTRETIIVSVDKDLNTIPGWHYNPKKKERYLVSPRDALRFFYYQLLVGDSADNIKGAKGIGPKKAERILETAFEDWCAEAGTEEELAAYYFEAVQGYFSCHEELMLNARCLYIWQKENDEWHPPCEVVSGMDTSS